MPQGRIENQIIAVRPWFLRCFNDFLFEENSTAVSDAADHSRQEGNEKASGNGNADNRKPKAIARQGFPTVAHWSLLVEQNKSGGKDFPSEANRTK
jgi:hypothetical protein